MSLLSQAVQLKLRNIIDVHTCQLSWNFRAEDSRVLDVYEYWVSPTFRAIGNPISWCVELKWFDICSGRYDAQLCVESGSIGDGVSIAGHTKIIVPYSSRLDSSTTEDYFSTSKTTAKKGKTLTIISSFRSGTVGRGSKRDMTITCEVTFFELDNIVSRVLSNEQISVPPTDLYTLCAPRIAGFAKLYLNETGSDVWLIVNGNKYPAHKTILIACSDVFEAMFKHDMQENQHKRVEINDIDEKVFLEALRYMYMGHVEDLDTLVFDLVKVADQYDIKGLRELCGVVLHGKLSVENVLKILLLADSCNVDNLRSPAIDFIAKYSKDVLKEMNEDEWKELVARPNLLKSVLELCINIGVDAGCAGCTLHSLLLPRK